MGRYLRGCTTTNKFWIFYFPTNGFFDDKHYFNKCDTPASQYFPMYVFIRKKILGTTCITSLVNTWQLISLSGELNEITWLAFSKNKLEIILINRSPSTSHSWIFLDFNLTFSPGLLVDWGEGKEKIKWKEMYACTLTGLVVRRLQHQQNS